MCQYVQNQNTHDLTQCLSNNLFDQDASFFLINNMEIRGCILFEKQENDYILSYFCVIGEKSPVSMVALLLESYKALKNSCSGDTKIYMNALTETIQKMIVRITEGKAQLLGEAVTRYYTY